MARTAHLCRDVSGVDSVSKLDFAVPGRFVRFWASGGAKLTKMGDSLPWTPMIHRGKFDAASFTLAGEIRNRTNKQTKRKKNKKTVNDISTPCLSACVDNRSDIVSIDVVLQNENDSFAAKF